MFPWKVLFVLLFSLLGACSMPATRRDVAPRPTPLLLISIDGFRADYLDRD